MGRYLGPRGKIERREQQDMSFFSGVVERENKIKVNSIPGRVNWKPTKISQYGKQFRAKQLLKRTYGLLERQFRNYFNKAKKLDGPSGENLWRLLEMRLDNVIFRLGFATTRRESRQLVSHKKIEVYDCKNRRVINLPSYQVKENFVISIREKFQNQVNIQRIIAMNKDRIIPEWLELDSKKLCGKLREIPKSDNISEDLKSLLFLTVELYSK